MLLKPIILILSLMLIVYIVCELNLTHDIGSYLTTYNIYKVNLMKRKRYITCTYIDGWTGGLGNQLYRFAVLYGMGRELGREVYFDGRNKIQVQRMTDIAEIFPFIHDNLHIKFPIDEDVYYSKKIGFQDFGYEKSIKSLSNISHPFIRIKATWLQVYHYFHPKYQNEIRQLFTCAHGIMKQVNEFARYLFKNDSSHLLCAHIRRGDYLNFALEESTKEFILPALEFITTYLKNAGHNNISLLFIGNDIKFVKELNLTNYKFSSIYTPEPLSKGGDMCLGANYCKSMLIPSSGSTYGWWMSYLMPENSTVFYNSKMTRNRSEIYDKERYDYNIFLKEWISLSVKNGTAYHEKKWWHERGKDYSPRFLF